MAIQQLNSVNGYTEIPYGLHYPSVRKDVNEKNSQRQWKRKGKAGKAMDTQYFLNLTTVQNQRKKMKKKMMQKFFKVQK